MYLDKLLWWHFITLDSSPRGKVRVTNEGDLPAEIFAVYNAIE